MWESEDAVAVAAGSPPPAEVLKAAAGTGAPPPPIVTPVAVVRALVDLPAGAELTHAYGGIALPLSERRALLARSFGIARCACDRCEAEDAEAAAAAAEIEAAAAGASALARGADLRSASLFASGAEELASALVAGGGSSGSIAPTLAKLRTSPGFMAPPPPARDAHPDAVTATAQTAVLLHALDLRRRWLPLFHPDVTAVVDVIYRAAAVGGDFAVAAAAGRHVLAQHITATARMPAGAVHTTTALQLQSLGDLYFNAACDAAARYEERVSDHAADDAEAVAREQYAAHVRDVCGRALASLEADAPPMDSALPEPLFAAAASCYKRSAAALRLSFGPCSLARVADQRVAVCAEIAREAAERAAAQAGSSA